MCFNGGESGSENLLLLPLWISYRKTKDIVICMLIPVHNARSWLISACVALHLSSSGFFIHTNRVGARQYFHWDYLRVRKKSDTDNECNWNANQLHYFASHLHYNWISIWIDLGFNWIVAVVSATVSWLSQAAGRSHIICFKSKPIKNSEVDKNTLKMKKKSPTNWSQVFSFLISGKKKQSECKH